MNDTLRIPIRANYRVIDGEVTRISAEYADISADFFARFLMTGLGMSFEEIAAIEEPAQEGAHHE